MGWITKAIHGRAAASAIENHNKRRRYGNENARNHGYHLNDEEPPPPYTFQKPSSGTSRNPAIPGAQGEPSARRRPRRGVPTEEYWGKNGVGPALSGQGVEPPGMGGNTGMHQEEPPDWFKQGGGVGWGGQGWPTDPYSASEGQPGGAQFNQWGSFGAGNSRSGFGPPYGYQQGWMKGPGKERWTPGNEILAEALFGGQPGPPPGHGRQKSGPHVSSQNPGFVGDDDDDEYDDESSEHDSDCSTCISDGSDEEDSINNSEEADAEKEDEDEEKEPPQKPRKRKKSQP